MKWTYLTLAIVLLSSLAFVSLADNNISITPENPGSNDVLTCSIRGEEQGFDFVWFKNDDGGEDINDAIFIGNPLNLNDLDVNPGDFIKCVVWLPDVIGQDQPLGKDTIMINAAPFLQIIRPFPLSEFEVGEEIRFVSVIADPDGDELDFRIDYGDGTNSRMLVERHSYNRPGVYTITAVVEDPRGAQSTDSIEITIVESINALPNVEIISPEEGDQFEIGQDVPFRAIVNDPDGDELEINWNFDDGNAANGAENVDHTYNQAGRKTITITVDDGNGGVITDDVTITIIPEQELRNQPPVIVVDYPEDVCLNELTVFDASRTTDDITAFGNLRFIWDVYADGIIDMAGFGDQVFNGATPYAKPSFKFNILGLNRIILTVVDRDNEPAIKVINVNVVICEANIPPVVDFEIENDRICAGDNVIFDASRTTDNKDNLENLFFKWFFGDEVPGADGVIHPRELGLGEKRVSHRYIFPGFYTTKLIVLDKEANEAEKSVEIEVLDCSDERSPPVVEFEIIPNNENVCIGSNVIFDASRTTDNKDDIRDLHFSWFVEGELFAQGNGLSRVEFRSVKEGFSGVELIVRDLDGNMGTTGGYFNSIVCPRTSAYTGLEVLSIRPLSQQESYSSDDIVTFVVNVRNTGNVDQVVRVLSSVPSLGVSNIGRSFDIRSEDSQNVLISVQIPDHSNAGWHVIRVDLFGQRGAESHGNYAFLVV